MKYPVGAIARYSLLEAVRSHIFLLVVPGVIILFGISQFVGELAVTESREIQAAITAYIIRVLAVIISCLFIVLSSLREFNEKTVDIIFALPVPRYVYYLGKLFGFSGLVIIIAILFSLPLFLYTDMLAVVYWSLSLVCELFIMTSLSLLFLLTLGNATVTLSLVIAFYVLSRTIVTIQLIATSPVIEATSLSQHLINSIIDVIAFLLPDLSRFAQTEWLMTGSVDLNEISFVFLQTTIYVVLLSAAALFDLYRKEF
jgi:Cu-processing system permease protein